VVWSAFRVKTDAISSENSDLFNTENASAMGASADNSSTVLLPSFPSGKGIRGRPTQARQIKLDAFKAALAKVMLSQYRRGVRWSTRGWCYSLEEFGLGKNDFDAAENIIVDLRKDGIVPLDAVLEDVAREWSGFEALDYPSVADEAQSILKSIGTFIRWYRPISFWDTQDAFVCMAVEKRDLISIFQPICREYHVPIANFRGSPDLLSRGKVLREFMKHWDAGRRVVVLYCGDHDPAGLRMSGAEMVSNFAALDGTLLDGERLYFNRGLFTVDRFGLNAGFIEEAGIKWTENLLTGQKDAQKCADLADPKHPDHFKPYVQDYIREFGPQKVEANVLVNRQEKGQALCREAIERYIKPDSITAYNKALTPLRQTLQVEVLKQLESFELEEVAS
jgi:hypothetical protein